MNKLHEMVTGLLANFAENEWHSVVGRVRQQNGELQVSQVIVYFETPEQVEQEALKYVGSIPNADQKYEIHLIARMAAQLIGLRGQLLIMQQAQNARDEVSEKKEEVKGGECSATCMRECACTGDCAPTEPAAQGEARSSHRVFRREDWLPCYCAAQADHPIGAEKSEQPAERAVSELLGDLEMVIAAHTGMRAGDEGSPAMTIRVCKEAIRVLTSQPTDSKVISDDSQIKPAERVPSSPTSELRSSLKKAYDDMFEANEHIDAAFIAMEFLDSRRSQLLECVNGEFTLNSELVKLLPGTRYMDPPDGGSTSVLEQLKRMSEDAARLNHIIQLCGYTQNASDVTVKLFQDDATHTWHVSVGKNPSFWGHTPREAIDKAAASLAFAYCPNCKVNRLHHGDPNSIHLHLCDVCNGVVDY